MDKSNDENLELIELSAKMEAISKAQAVIEFNMEVLLLPPTITF